MRVAIFCLFVVFVSVAQGQPDVHRAIARRVTDFDNLLDFYKVDRGTPLSRWSRQSATCRWHQRELQCGFQLTRATSWDGHECRVHAGSHTTWIPMQRVGSAWVFAFGENTPIATLVQQGRARPGMAARMFTLKLDSDDLLLVVREGRLDGSGAVVAGDTRTYTAGPRGRAFPIQCTRLILE